MISLAKEKEYKKIQGLIENVKMINLTQCNNHGENPQSIIFKRLIEHVQAGNLEELKQIRSILKDNFILRNKCEPLLYKNGVGQYDSTNNLIKEFECKYECIKQLKISDKTLAKALDKPIMYQNCYYKNIGSKLKCF